MKRCWAASLGGCSGTISREHIVTKGIWEGNEIAVQGLPWCPDEYKLIPKSKYWAKVLCTKHNSNLSPVDESAIEAFSGLRTAREVGDRRHRSRKNEKYLRCIVSNTYSNPHLRNRPTAGTALAKLKLENR